MSKSIQRFINIVKSYENTPRNPPIGNLLGMMMVFEDEGMMLHEDATSIRLWLVAGAKFPTEALINIEAIDSMEVGED